MTTEKAAAVMRGVSRKCNVYTAEHAVEAVGKIIKQACGATWKCKLRGTHWTYLEDGLMIYRVCASGHTPE